MHTTPTVFPIIAFFLNFKETVKSVIMYGPHRFYWMSLFCLLMLHSADLPKAIVCVIPDCPAVAVSLYTA